MPEKKSRTAERVRSIVEPIVKGLGLELWDVRFLKEGAQWYLRIYIDSPQGVSINHCEEVSRAIDGPLDREDPIEQSYILEVCSPGLQRSLLTDEHFLKYIGADIMVKMIRPVEGIGREFKGVLKAYDKGKVTVEDHSGENRTVINRNDAAWIKLDDFDITEN